LQGEMKATEKNRTTILPCSVIYPSTAPFLRRRLTTGRR
jgi:hypothetical protein